MQLTGYRRENGRVGIRNYVVVLPVDEERIELSDPSLVEDETQLARFSHRRRFEVDVADMEVAAVAARAAGQPEPRRLDSGARRRAQ